MMRAVLRAVTLFTLAFAGVALAQSAAANFNIGARTIGETHDYRLTARNDNCPQPLDFRFEFAPSSWLKPRGETVIRAVPAGESRALPVVIDLTQMPPGRHTAEVAVACENCGLPFFRTCRFDRQLLTISVDAVAPQVAAPQQPAPRPLEPAAQPPSSQPAPSATMPAPAAVTPAPQVGAAAPQGTAPLPATADCDCADAALLWQVAAAATGLAALGAIVACFVFATSAAGAATAAAANRAGVAAKAREMLRLGEDAPRESNDTFDHARDGAQKLLEQQQAECEARRDRCRDELAALLGAQLQALHALSAVALLDAARPDVATQLHGWSKIGEAAKRLSREARTPVTPELSALSQDLQSAHGKLQSEQALLTSPDSAGALPWLQAQKLATGDDDARAVIDEITSYTAHGGNLSDMSTRLQRSAETCRRAEAELAILTVMVEAP